MAPVVVFIKSISAGKRKKKREEKKRKDFELTSRTRFPLGHAMATS